MGAHARVARLVPTGRAALRRLCVDLVESLGDVLPLTQEALAQLLGVRRTTVTLTMSKLRAGGAIRSERRGLIEVDRAQLDGLACECYGLMQRRIDRMYCEELSTSRVALAMSQENSMAIIDGPFG